MSKLRRSIKGGPLDIRVTEIENAIVEYDRRADFATEIGKLWHDAQQKFMLIGQYLNQAKAKLPRGEFETMIEQDLPFGKTTAYQLRTIAEAIESGRLPAERVPSDYTAVYYLASLSDDELRQADEHSLIRPDVPRRAVIEFKRAMRQAAPQTASPLEREALLRKRSELLAQLAEIDRLLDEIQ
jgi:hypothetical protein